MADPEIPVHLNEMWITLSSSVGIMAETQALTLTGLVERMSSSGMNKEIIRETLLRDLREGGQIFGDFRKQFKTNIKWGIEETARREFEQGLDKVNGMWEWLGVSDNRICPDCAKRNSKSPMKWAEWESEGLPGTGITICGTNCRCMMAIVETIDKPPGGIIVNSR